MKRSTATYGSPEVAKAVAMAAKGKSKSVQVNMRTSKDVPAFLKKLENAKKATRKNALQFG